jgi:general secretion pathway protein H
MRTSAPGSSGPGPVGAHGVHRARRVAGTSASPGGFTLIEVMVVLAIVAVGAGLISLAIRDPAETRLEQEGARLVALLEIARIEARAGGLDAAWVPGNDPQSPGFRFVGLPATLALPSRWLDERVSAQVAGAAALTLGPDAILPPQRVLLRLETRQLAVGSDGLSAFSVLAADGATP